MNFGPIKIQDEMLKNFLIGFQMINNNMKQVLSEIQDGTFKKQWADENATDGANLKEMRAAEEKLDIEIVGARLRKACGLEKDD